MKSLKNIAFVCAGIYAVLAVSSCDVKIVDAGYPSQKIYLPAAVESNIYTVDQANISTGSTPTTGNPYQFLIDYDEGTFTIPLSIYRSGINNDGAVNVDVWLDEELVYDTILDGGLSDDVEVITGDILLEFNDEDLRSTEQLQAALLTAGWHGRFIHRAVTTNKIDHADVSRLKVQLGLDAAALRKSWEDL